MSAKRPFVEPRIVADAELDVASQDFPLMPLVGLSTAFLTGDSIVDTSPADGINGLSPDGFD